jgi:hypothetical protein
VSDSLAIGESTADQQQQVIEAGAGAEELNALPTGRLKTPVRRKAIAMTAIIVWFQAQLIEARARAAEEAERGEIVEKVIIVAAAAAIAIAAMAAIAAAVDIKIAGLEL